MENWRVNSEKVRGDSSMPGHTIHGTNLSQGNTPGLSTAAVAFIDIVHTAMQNWSISSLNATKCNT